MARHCGPAHGLFVGARKMDPIQTYFQHPTIKVSSFPDTYVHIPTCTYIDIYTYIQTHIHTYIYPFFWNLLDICYVFKKIPFTPKEPPMTSYFVITFFKLLIKFANFQDIRFLLHLIIKMTLTAINTINIIHTSP